MAESDITCPHCQKQMHVTLISFKVGKDFSTGKPLTGLNLDVKPVSPAARRWVV
jgi:hypothetical protein